MECERQVLAVARRRGAVQMVAGGDVRLQPVAELERALAGFTRHMRALEVPQRLVEGADAAASRKAGARQRVWWVAPGVQQLGEQNAPGA